MLSWTLLFKIRSFGLGTFHLWQLNIKIVLYNNVIVLRVKDVYDVLNVLWILL